MSQQDVATNSFAVVNSLLVTLCVSGVVAMILVRSLKRDLLRYQEIDEMLGDEDDDGAPYEDFGWKVVAHDVFRKPPMSSTLCWMVATGTQLFWVLTILFTISLVGIYSPSNRGALLSSAIIFFAALGVVSGYQSGKLNNMLGGEKRREVALSTALWFPGIMFGLFFILDLIIFSQRSSGAVPFGTLVALCGLWFGISTPLVFVGTYLAYKSQPEPWPVKVNQIPRLIPDLPWLAPRGLCAITLPRMIHTSLRSFRCQLYAALFCAVTLVAQPVCLYVWIHCACVSHHCNRERGGGNHSRVFWAASGRLQLVVEGLPGPGHVWGVHPRRSGFSGSCTNSSELVWVLQSSSFNSDYKHHDCYLALHVSSHLFLSHWRGGIPSMSVVCQKDICCCQGRLAVCGRLSATLTSLPTSLRISQHRHKAYSREAASMRRGEPVLRVQCNECTEILQPQLVKGQLYVAHWAAREESTVSPLPVESRLWHRLIAEIPSVEEATSNSQTLDNCCIPLLKKPRGNGRKVCGRHVTLTVLWAPAHPAWVVLPSASCDFSPAVGSMVRRSEDQPPNRCSSSRTHAHPSAERQTRKPGARQQLMGQLR
eukprot:scaffold705_cov402-Prasinococcus_capsulatus_cf.AAC.15